MTKRKSKAMEQEPPDTGDLLSHVLEDVYVEEGCKQHGRSVRLVTHEDSDTVEVISCDEAAVKKAKDRLTSGNFTVRGSVLRRPSNKEIAELMRRYRVEQLLAGKANRKRLGK